MSTLPLSCFIITKNEADRLGKTLERVQGLVDEIIIIDSGSTDGTRHVAEAMGAKFHHRDWTGYGEQKRYGEDQCTHNWLLNLDADEVLSDALINEIRALFTPGEPTHAGYRLEATELLPGESRLPPLAQVNKVIRLYDKRCGRFSTHPVHDSVIMEKGEVGECRAPLWHYSFRSLNHAVEKLNYYSTMQAEAKSLRITPWIHCRFILEFTVNFFKAYFLRGYVFRGLNGFTYAMIYAFSRFLRVAKMLEKETKER